MLTAQRMSREIRQESFSSVLLCVLRGESSLAPIDLPILHDELHIPELLDVFEGIAGDSDDIRESARCYHADLPFPVEHHRRARGRALDGIHGLHTEFHHSG